MDFGPNLANLLVAAGLSALIGFEREYNKRDAGLRTHVMVGMGAALFTIVGAEAGQDPTRMAAQVVSGIGFIGAGTIFRAGESIKGLTTAAGMWTVAGIGVAAGFGMLLLATTATVVALVVLFGLLPIVERIGAKGHTEDKEASEGGASEGGTPENEDPGDKVQDHKPPYAKASHDKASGDESPADEDPDDKGPDHKAPA